jgi:hypothetical protein
MTINAIIGMGRSDFRIATARKRDGIWVWEIWNGSFRVASDGSKWATYLGFVDRFEITPEQQRKCIEHYQRHGRAVDEGIWL